MKRETGNSKLETGAARQAEIAARDERYAAVIAGCDRRVAMAAVDLIETRAGLEKARRLEHENQARSSVLDAIDKRLGTGAATSNIQHPTSNIEGGRR